jgi:hypothetical protein
MIEAWWRSLKHGWPYLHQLDTFADLERLVTFHVGEARVKANRSLTCAACRVSAEASPDTPDSLAISDPLQLHAEDSRMS